jgi:hypothetical protein
VQTRNGRVVNYPGPKLSEKEEAEQKTRQYPNMFPPEGTVMFSFLTSRWIHIWIAMVRCSSGFVLSFLGLFIIVWLDAIEDIHVELSSQRGC